MKSRIPFPDGAAALPSVIREVARAANRAGLAGYVVGELTIGIDEETKRALKTARGVAVESLRNYVLIDYKGFDVPIVFVSQKPREYMCGHCGAVVDEAGRVTHVCGPVSGASQ